MKADGPPGALQSEWLGGGWRKVPCYERSHLTPGATFSGRPVEVGGRL